MSAIHLRLPLSSKKASRACLSLTLCAVVCGLAQAAVAQETPAEFQKRYDAEMARITEKLGIPAPSELWKFKSARPPARPRMMFGSLTREDLVRRAADPRYAQVVAKVRSFAKASAEKPLPAKIDPDIGSDPNRVYADSLAWMAMAYMIEPDPSLKKFYLDGTLRWSRAIIASGVWHHNAPLAQAVIGHSSVYDWLYDDLSEADRKLIRDYVVASVRYSKDINNRNFWFCKLGFNMNHHWMQYGGHIYAALALRGDEDKTDLKPGELDRWLDDAVLNYAIADRSHPADGAPSEGPGYQDYGLRTYVDIATVADEQLVLKHSLFDDRLKLQSDRVFMMLPGQSGYLLYADGHPSKWFGTASWWFKMAERFNDPKAQRVGLATEAMGKGGGQGWRSLLFYNPDLTPVDLASLPTHHDFPDLGVYTARQNWSGSETFFGLRAGTYGGLTPMADFGKDLTQGHNYPNQGEVIYYDGKAAVLPGREYSPLKRTADHHLVVFDGRGDEAGQLVGQFGEGAEWFWNRGRKVLRPASVLPPVHTDTYHAYVCDLGGVYPVKDDRAQGGQFYPEYRRGVVYVPDGGLVIVDRVRTPFPRTMHFRLLTAATDLALADGAYTFSINGKKGFIRNFSAAAASPRVEKVVLESTFRERYPRDAAILTAPETTAGDFAVVLGTGPALKDVTVKTDDAGFTVSGLKSGDVRVDWPKAQ